ncbi:MAG TPA: cation:proton antiporter, partial [Bryobacteraceae bacterium]|nr:cation:proton antiporter [Bryobacteraceae bacterium]
ESTTAILILFVLASALSTEALGIHLLFGAFLAGSIMPKDRAFVHGLLEKFETVTVVLLLPLFFAFTGLRTSIALVKGAELWGYCLLIIAVAIVGKLGGSLMAARTAGMPWRDASALGILMNTRGLMELVILNIGLDIGVISPTLFSMMVVMALVTTFMTTPLLEWVFPVRKIREMEGEPSYSALRAKG